MGKEKKQFPLDSKEKCCIYLCRIISSCELCMDKFKKYNAQTKNELEKYNRGEVIPYDTYSELCDKTYNVISYLLNLLGDCQTTSISYFKYRQQIQKRITRGNTDIPLTTISTDVIELMSEFNKMRNWQNHTTDEIEVDFDDDDDEDDEETCPDFEADRIGRCVHLCPECGKCMLEDC